MNNLDIDKINTINTRAKIRDRINHIRFLGGELKYLRVEKDTMNHNLKIIDSCMPKILGNMLLKVVQPPKLFKCGAGLIASGAGPRSEPRYHCTLP